MVIDPFIDLCSVQTLSLKTRCTKDDGNQPSAIRVEPPDFLHRDHGFRWIKMRVPGLAEVGKSQTARVIGADKKYMKENRRNELSTRPESGARCCVTNG
jgi:hypothetical protein